MSTFVKKVDFEKNLLESRYTKIDTVFLALTTHTELQEPTLPPVVKCKLPSGGKLHVHAHHVSGLRTDFRGTRILSRVVGHRHSLLRLRSEHLDPADIVTTAME